MQSVRSHKLAAFATIVLFGCGAPAASAPSPGVYKMALPSGANVEMMTALDATTGDVGLVVSPAGQLYVLTNELFVPLGGDARPFQVKDASPISSVAWVDDDVLLLVSGTRLGVASPDGFVPLLDLPSPAMHIAYAAPDACFVYGGKGDLAKRLFFYLRGGKLVPFAALPGEIRAVSGSFSHFYVAASASIFEIEMGRPAELVFEGIDPVTALVGTGAGAFFSTPRGTYFLGVRGTLRQLAREGASAMYGHGDTLYVVFQRAAIVRTWPLQAFVALEP
jgi:hypothetical protein